jgi:hypothetical protein
VFDGTEPDLCPVLDMAVELVPWPQGLGSCIANKCIKLINVVEKKIMNHTAK